MTDETTDPTPPVAAISEEAVEAAAKAGFEHKLLVREMSKRYAWEAIINDPSWSEVVRSCRDRARYQLEAVLPHLHVQPTPGPVSVVTEVMVEAGAQELWHTEVGRRANHDDDPEYELFPWDECGGSMTDRFREAARSVLEAAAPSPPTDDDAHGAAVTEARRLVDEQIEHLVSGAIARIPADAINGRERELVALLRDERAAAPPPPADAHGAAELNAFAAWADREERAGIHGAITAGRQDMSNGDGLPMIDHITMAEAVAQFRAIRGEGVADGDDQ